jgi:D-tyrosyl-tRNA(Tyr) deacylase
MRVLVQRVKSAGVSVNSKGVSEIDRGMLLLVGIGKDDSDDDIEYMSRKISNLRIFEDKEGKMNLNIKQAEGAVLSISQFTLYADTRKGNRPGFEQSADPDTAKALWGKFNKALKNNGLDVQEGIFGAHMEVELINDGPVTIWLDSKAR